MMLLLLKAKNPGYFKKDGTYVKPFVDKRPDAPAEEPVVKQPPKWKWQPKGGSYHGSNGWEHKTSWGDEKPKGGSQGSLFGGWGKEVGYVAPPKPKLQPQAFHPKPGEKGEKVGIYRPHKPTDAATWDDAASVATFVPGGDCPPSLNGVSFTRWKDHPRTDDGWDYVEGQMDDLDEPPMKLPAGKKAASGVIIEEPDGRVWLVHPTNEFAGYKATFPKGGAEEGLSLQANAIKECFEESGLKVEITGLFGDFERGTTVARYYRAKRVGGSPIDCGWETQAVSLVPKGELHDHLNGSADRPVATAIGAKDPTIKPMKADGWKQVGKQLGSNPGGFFEDDRGQEWYCKTPESEDHARNEILASKLYEELGIRAPEMKLISRKGKVGVASKIIPVLVKDKEALRAGLVPGALEGFAADAWLANWDSVGLSFDNMLVDGEGAAVRVDPGGALLYRARGAPKGKAFGDHVGEIDTLRDGSNAQAADVFQHVTDEHIAEGVRKIVGIPDDRIKELCSKFGPGSSKTRAALADRLIARKKDLAARFL